MGYPRKKTPVVMDRIVQIIWHFKHLHGETETPSTALIANELGITPSGVGPYITKLEEAGRVDRIQVRPMRVTLLDHPMNKRAIKLFQRELEKAHKPLDMPKPKAEPKPEPAEDVIVVDAQPEELKQAVEALSTTIAPERARVVSNWADAEKLVANHGGDLQEIATRYILATARPGDLLEALLDRGYTVHKTNPKWRD